MDFFLNQYFSLNIFVLTRICDRGCSFPFDFKPNGVPYLVQNQKENCHHDHIPSHLTGNENPFS